MVFLKAKEEEAITEEIQHLSTHQFLENLAMTNQEDIKKLMGVKPANL